MTYSVSLGSVIDEFQLEEINKPEGSRDRPVNRSEVNRPGLALAGFFGYFEPGRIQIIGLSENDYISKLDDAKMREIFDRFFSTDPVAVVFSTSLPVSGTIIESADRFGVPLLRTSSKTSEFMAALISSVLDDTPKVAEYIAECSRLGIEVVPPHVNVSSERFTARDGKIYFGLLAVKNVGAGFIREIERERKTGGEFTSFYSFCKRMQDKEFNKRAVESLIKCGALDGLGANRRQM